jgi:dihydrodipicolinate synthase/N-acetylneuraminate lyase
VGSTKGSIQLSKEAAEAGADFAIVIPSGYYAGALGREALKQYFIDVAEASPIPVMVYNCESDPCLAAPFSLYSACKTNVRGTV